MKINHQTKHHEESGIMCCLNNTRGSHTMYPPSVLPSHCPPRIIYARCRDFRRSRTSSRNVVYRVCLLFNETQPPSPRLPHAAIMDLASRLLMASISRSLFDERRCLLPRQRVDDRQAYGTAGQVHFPDVNENEKKLTSLKTDRPPSLFRSSALPR